MAVYIGFFLGVIVLFLIWRIFFESIIMIFKKFCGKYKSTFILEEVVADNFYDIVNFKSLRILLEENTTELGEL